MAGRVEGKVALITGAGRGRGRSHAVRPAEEGADIIAVDLCQPIACQPIASVPYPMGTADDLADTAQQVEAVGRRIVATQADVRDPVALTQALDAGGAELGRLDVVVANAGIFRFRHAGLCLASDEVRYITGVTLPVDAGTLVR